MTERGTPFCRETSIIKRKNNRFLPHVNLGCEGPAVHKAFKYCTVLQLRADNNFKNV